MPCLSHLGRLPRFGLRVSSPCCLCGMSSTRNLAPSLHLRNLFELWSLLLSIHPELTAATTLIIHHSLCCFCAKLRCLCLKLHVESILGDTSTGQPQQRGCCSALMSPLGKSWVPTTLKSGDNYWICPETQWRRFWLDTLISSLTPCSGTAFCEMITTLFPFQ